MSIKPPGTETRSIGIVLERRKVDNPWIDHSWRPVQILLGQPASPRWTRLAAGDGWEWYFAGQAELALYRHETENYQFNLDSTQPSIWVFLRQDGESEHGIELFGATVDPGEAQAHNDTGDDLVESIAMPDDIVAWVSGYIQSHPPARPYRKRKRTRADPEALALRPRVRPRLYESDPLRQMPEDE
ncbi:MAG TPA: DUF3305 domain-containing protein [Ferrovibrio sp.]|jgi:hypothetical protein|uniref:DUF3305 domain-containing protein n=1 Tax=Ferrovibrio sp. TaxID=1917215 RepID=UPI002ED490F1